MQRKQLDSEPCWENCHLMAGNELTQAASLWLWATWHGWGWKEETFFCFEHTLSVRRKRSCSAVLKLHLPGTLEILGKMKSSSSGRFSFVLCHWLEMHFTEVLCTTRLIQEGHLFIGFRELWFWPKDVDFVKRQWQRTRKVILSFFCMQRKQGSQSLIVQNRLIFTNCCLQQLASLAPHTLYSSHFSVRLAPPFGPRPPKTWLGKGKWPQPGGNGCLRHCLELCRKLFRKAQLHKNDLSKLSSLNIWYLLSYNAKL